MVDSIGASVPPSVQAVNKARSNAQAQKAESSQFVADEVSISAEAKELGEVNRLASDARELLAARSDTVLSSPAQGLDKLL